jgi:DNA polymerase-3 subunit delta
MKALVPDKILSSLKSGTIAPFYLFYGPEEFWREIVLDEIEKGLIPDSVKDFNLDILYADDVPAGEVLNRARLVPFMSPRRLIIVRRTEQYSKADRELFLSYMDNPPESTCIIWVWGGADAKDRFFVRCRESGRAVNFKKLTEGEAFGWMHKRAAELGIRIDREAAGILYQMVGSSLGDLYSELEKISARFPHSRIGVDQIKDSATFSRLFTVFDLVDYVFHKDALHALETLHRLLETQGRDSSAILGILGMVARQIRLICRAKEGERRARDKRGAAERLKPLPHYVIEKCIAEGRLWEDKELGTALSRIYDADGLIRAGSQGDLVLEHLVVQLCRPLS